MRFHDALTEAARKCIGDALIEANGNVALAAKLLGVNRTHMYWLAAKYGAQLKPIKPVRHSSPRRRAPHVRPVFQEMANWRRA